MPGASGGRVKAPAPPHKKGARKRGKQTAGKRVSAAPEGHSLEHRILLPATLCLLAFGAVMVYSASSASTLLQGEGNGSGVVA